MRYAIVADIHGNYTALKAVFEDLKNRNISHVMCLGNIVGLGPKPAKCVDYISKNCFLSVLGNHDYAIVNKAVGCSHLVWRAIDWSRTKIEGGDPEIAANRWRFFEKLPERYDKNGISFVHGSPRDPVSEYVFPEDVDRDPRKLEESFALFEKVMFVGHTHIPGVFHEDISFVSATDMNNYFHYRRGAKVMINVGSVGFPRDGDRRACYIEINKNEMTWHRVDYDVEKVASSIEAQDELANIFARRLREAY